MNIRIDNLEGEEIAALLVEHHQDMLKHSPPESVHALDLRSLKASEVTFWSAWRYDCLVGCGALKQLDTQHAEIKSMRTSAQHLRKGVARKLLQHILEVAKSRGYKRISLETGSMQAFEPARKLYASFGFDYCLPFEGYSEDPYSLFLTKEI